MLDEVRDYIAQKLHEYHRTQNGEHLLEAIREFLQHSGVHDSTSTIYQLYEAFALGFVDRWQLGRVDPWNPASEPVRTLGQAFRVADRARTWKPKAIHAMVSPVNDQGERVSPGEQRHFWARSVPSLEGRELTSADVPVGVSFEFSALWVMDRLVERKWLTTRPNHPRNAFQEAARLLNGASADLDGRTKAGRGRIGAKSIESLYYAHRTKRGKPRVNSRSKKNETHKGMKCN